MSAEELQAFQTWKRSNAERLAYHVTMYQKYKHAARYPWLRVEPDPPEPN